MYKNFLLSLSFIILSVFFDCNAILTDCQILNPVKFFESCQATKADTFTNQETDLLAQECCRKNNKTLIAIVWPRGQAHMELIKSMMKPNCTLLYEKNFYLQNDGAKHLDQIAHQSKKRKEIKYHETAYVPKGTPAPYKCTAILFETDMTKDNVVSMKYAIRDVIGATYFSIHIDDYNDKSQYLAAHVFNDIILDSINIRKF